MGERTWRFMVSVESRQLIVVFDPHRKVADLMVEIDRRCQRMLLPTIIGRRVVGLFLAGAHPATTTPLKRADVLSQALTEGDQIYVELSSGVAIVPPMLLAHAASRTTITPLRGVGSVGRASPTLSKSGSAVRLVSRTSRPTSAAGARGSARAVRSSSNAHLAGSRALEPRPRTANADSSAASSPGARGRGSTDSISASALLEVEERSRLRQAEAAALRSPCAEHDDDRAHIAAWARADDDDDDDADASAHGGDGSHDDAAAQARSHMYTPRSVLSTLSGGAARELEAHQRATRERHELDEEMLIARRRALNRFPSAAEPTLGASADAMARRASQASAAGLGRPLSARERYMHQVAHEAHAASASASRARAQQPLPAWKEQLMRRSKVTALAPGRAQPKLFRALEAAAGEADARAAAAGDVEAAPPLSRARSALLAGSGRGERAGSAAARGGAAGAAGARPAPPALLTTAASSASLGAPPVPSVRPATAQPVYIARAMRDLEAAVSASAEFETFEKSGAGRSSPSSPGVGVGAVADGGMTGRSSRSALGARPTTAPAAAAPPSAVARQLAALEHRNFHYADGLAKEQLEARYLLEREDVLRGQIAERETQEAAALDSRFARVEDSGSKLLDAVTATQARLTDKLSLCDMRVNEMLAVHAELRATIAVLRKQHGGLLKQLQRAHARIASLGNDARHISHSAQAELDDGARAEAKLERSRNEYAYELEQHADESSALARTADELERALLENLGLADADAERSKQAEYTRVRARRERELELENRLGKLGETRAYLEAKLATVCQLVALKDEHLTSTTAAEVLQAFRVRENRNVSLWRTADGHLQARAALETELARMQHSNARLEASAFAQEDELVGERLNDDVGDTFDNLEVILAEFEPVIEALLDPIGRMFDKLQCYESEHVPSEALVVGLKRETLCDYVHGVDVAIRAEQFRAKRLIAQRGDGANEVLRAFVGTLRLGAEAKAGDDSVMRTAVLQQVARMEMLGFSSAGDD